MKKILSLLTTVILTTSTTTSVISCSSQLNNKANNIGPSDTASKITPANTKATKITPAKTSTKASKITPANTKASKITPSKINASRIRLANTKASKITPAKQRTSQDIINDLEGKKINIDNKYKDTLPSNSNTTKAIIDKLLLNNYISQDDSQYLTFKGNKLAVGNNYISVTANKGGKSATTPSIQSKELNVFVDSAASKDPKVIPNLSNYDMTTDKQGIKPINAPNIDYNKAKYTPWFDDGFNWYQFLDGSGANANGAGQLLNNILDSNNNVVNLGFITSYNDKAARGNKSKVVKEFVNWIKTNTYFDWTKQTVPTVGGILPLWFGNWTDAWGAITPDKVQKGSPIFKFLNKIREAGKDYTFSFGGWNGDSVAMDASLKGYSATNLAKYYEKIIDFFNLKTIDFDIEGTEDGKADDFGNQHTVAQGTAAKKLRYEAIQILKQNPKYKDIYITLTYPTFINKTSDTNISTTPMIMSLIKNDLVNKINLMAFDYGNINYGTRISAPGEMGIYAMSAANSMAQLLRNNGIVNPYSKIMITGMPGPEDTKNLVWTLTDQALLENFAVDKKLGGLSMWSSLYDMNFTGKTVATGRNFNLWNYNDMLNGTGTKDALASGLATAPYSFSNIFKLFGHGQKYAFNGKTAIPTALWQQIQNLNIANVSNVNNITQADIDSLCNTNFIFSNSIGFGDSWTNSQQTKTFLQAELNFAAWSAQYTQKHLN